MEKHLFGTKKSRIIYFAFLLFTIHLKAQVVQTFSYTGLVQSYTVPTCVTTVSLECFGATGGTSSSGTAPGAGGFGAHVGGVLSVNPGDVLNIYVGGVGGATTGGFNGGGNGGTTGAGGGGGASDVRLNGVLPANRVIVAGGGGGGGSTGCALAWNGGNGGDGGGLPGQAGTDSPNGGGGFGGTLNAGGAPGIGCGGFLGLPGTVPDGGNGQVCCCLLTPGGGGGGGGFVQGGGGGGGSAGTIGCQDNDKGGGGGGAGGSNYLGGVSSSYTLSNNQATVGLVAISYYACCPSVMAGLSNPAGVCAGGNVTLSASGVSSYTWVNMNSNAPSLVVSPNITTSYTVSGTNANGCVSSAVLVVNVNPLPVITASTSSAFVCNGQSVTLTASGASSYTWTSVNGLVGFGTTATVNPMLSQVPNATNYTATGTSTAGCVNTAQIYVTVDPNVMTATSNTTICLGNSIQLTANGTSNYSWTNNMDAGSSPFQSINPSPTVTTIYTVTGTDASNCVLTQTVSVGVNPNPVVTASTSKTLVCKGLPITISTTGADTYSWSTGQTTQNITVTPPLNTDYLYTVQGMDANGCTGTASLTIRAELCTGLPEINTSQNELHVFPNPNHGVFHVEIPGATKNMSIKVYSVSGALVKTQDVVSGRVDIDLQKEPDGIYFVHLFEGNTSISVSKILKQ